MQKARRSSIQSTKTYKAFQAFQPQDLTQAFQFYKDIPDIPVIHDIPALQALLHVPAPSSTIQYLPVLSSVSSVSRDSTHSSISSIRMLILHTDWFPPETPLSASRIQDNLQTFILQRKGDVVISVITFDIFYRIELRVKMTFSQSRINSPSALSSRATNC